MSTLVVSWNEAADRKLSVASEALVIPRISSSDVAASLPDFSIARFARSSAISIDRLTGQQVGVARRPHPHLLGHLPDDELDVLVVDVDALRLVDLLHLADHVLARAEHAPEAELLVGVERSFVERVTGLDLLAVLHLEPHAPAHGIRHDHFAEIVDHGDLLGRAGLVEVHLVDALRIEVLVDDLGLTLGLARLEEFDHPRQTVRDVGPGHTAGVEGTHGQLGARFTDGLRGDVPHGLTDGGQFVGGRAIGRSSAGTHRTRSRTP